MKKNAFIICIIILFLSGILSAEDINNDLNNFSDNAQFDNANQLYKLKKYDKALELFTEYLEIHPNGLHRKETYKNIASIYFEQFDYPMSIKSYNTLYQEYSNSEEGIEAYFMSGICYQKMGYLKKAVEIYKSVIDQHPESNYAYQAKINIDIIKILEEN